MTVDELIEVLKRVAELYGGDTKVRLEAYEHSNYADKNFNADTEYAPVFLESTGWTYDLNPDKFKVRTERPRNMYGPFDDTRYLSFGAYTCDGCHHRLNCKHSDWSELDYVKQEESNLNAKINKLSTNHKGDHTRKTKPNNFVYVIQVSFLDDGYENSYLLAESYTSRLEARKRMLEEAMRILQDQPDYEANTALSLFVDGINLKRKDDQYESFFTIEVLELVLYSSLEESKGE